MKVLVGEHLVKIAGNKNNAQGILNNISLKVDAGEFLGVMGPSGAGKTTLLKILSGLEKPTSGKVFLKGEEITRLKDQPLRQLRNKDLGFIFQDFNLVETLTIKDNLLLPLIIGKKSLPEMETSLKEVANLFGLTPFLSHYPAEISIGQKQRVAAARALINQPDIIFADEPTGALDSRNATELLRYLEKINQEKDTTILMVTHDPFTASYCQRILFIKDGAIFSELVRKNSRKEFFQKILQMQAAIGGDLFRV